VAYLDSGRVQATSFKVDLPITASSMRNASSARSDARPFNIARAHRRSDREDIWGFDPVDV